MNSEKLEREMSAISSDPWSRKIGEFCERAERPTILYSAHRLVARVEAQDESIEGLSRFKIRRWPQPTLRRWASAFCVPYWREMRTDELKAVLLRIYDAMEGPTSE